MDNAKTGKPVPFYSNLTDDAHCFQAALKMILKYFLPDRDFSWNELEKMTGRQKGKATWPQTMLLNLNDMGFDIVFVEGFDAKAFVKEGGDYIRRAYGDAVADWQTEHSDIAYERVMYTKLLESPVRYEHRVPTIQDMRSYLRQGYLITATVNHKALNNEKGYVGHAVVIYDVTDRQVIFHDPGLPGKENRVEDIAHFEAAWSSPNDQARLVIALKYKEPTL